MLIVLIIILIIIILSILYLYNPFISDTENENENKGKDEDEDEDEDEDKDEDEDEYDGDIDEITDIIKSVANSNPVIQELNSNKQTYDAAWVLIAIQEAVRLDSLTEEEAFDALSNTRYDRDEYEDAEDVGRDVIRFVKGELEHDTISDFDEEDIGSMSGKSVGDYSSIIAGLLTPLIWNDNFLSMKRAKEVIFDIQFVKDKTLDKDNGSEELGFLTKTKNGISFYRKQTSKRTQDNSGGSAENENGSIGWNQNNKERDSHKVAWEDDVAMGVSVAAMLVEHHIVKITDDEKKTIKEVFYGIATGYDDVFGNLQHAYDFETEEESPMRWTRSIGWGLFGLVLIMRTLSSLGYSSESVEVRNIIIKHIKEVYEWQDEDGLWFQNPNFVDDEDNYIETTGSSLILAATAEIIRQGYLKEYKEKYEMGMEELLTYIDDDGNVENCVSGTSIGANAKFYYVRDVDEKEDCEKIGLVALVNYNKLLKENQL
ncbi:hypothetical protein MKD35_343 [Aureococcus anophagefferens virus]|nr:hypothetical protein MKD35_343 [Aureococcus anophagefferens virus]